MKNKEIERIERFEGFTLMEVVIAITIFAVCVSAVYLVYSSVINVVDNVEQVTGQDRDARVVLERLSLDFKGLYRATEGFLNGREPADRQDGEPFLAFTSSSHLVLNPDEYSGDIAVIRYYLAENDDKSLYTLSRSDTLQPGRFSPDNTVEAGKHVLAEDVAGLEIIYIDEEGGEVEEWESDTGDNEEEENGHFPRAVRFSLQLGDPGDSDSTPVEYRDGVVVPKLVYMFEDES